ncbi:MAG: hypothetical protein SHS37scaffold220_8 [Phage 67_12]|nr:MAG: hypothetical protein SHS37scaffold220_8 [Phage 67_12]
MTKFTAPFMAGRMAPGIFTYFVGRKARFPGDPWPDQIPSPAWYWMHSDACRADPAGSGHAMYRDKRAASGLRETWSAAAPAQTPTPPARVRQAQIDLFQGTAP